LRTNQSSELYYGSSYFFFLDCFELLKLRQQKNHFGPVVDFFIVFFSDISCRKLNKPDPERGCWYSLARKSIHLSIDSHRRSLFETDCNIVLHPNYKLFFSRHFVNHIRLLTLTKRNANQLVVFNQLPHSSCCVFSKI
jgi:hypothetical protein